MLKQINNYQSSVKTEGKMKKREADDGWRWAGSRGQAPTLEVTTVVGSICRHWLLKGNWKMGMSQNGMKLGFNKGLKKKRMHAFRLEPETSTLCSFVVLS